jgi:hypothetical protein
LRQSISLFELELVHLPLKLLADALKLLSCRHRLVAWGVVLGGLDALDVLSRTSPSSPEYFLELFRLPDWLLRYPLGLRQLWNTEEKVLTIFPLTPCILKKRITRDLGTYLFLFLLLVDLLSFEDTYIQDPSQLVDQRQDVLPLTDTDNSYGDRDDKFRIDCGPSQITKIKSTYFLQRWMMMQTTKIIMVAT